MLQRGQREFKIKLIANMLCALCSFRCSFCPVVLSLSPLFFVPLFFLDIHRYICIALFDGPR
jgi:hypothetical protein